MSVLSHKMIKREEFEKSDNANKTQEKLQTPVRSANTGGVYLY